MTEEEAQAKAARAYNAAADSYDSEPLSFWDYFGQRTVRRLGLSEGARVLDVCCGSGASAIPAAQVVGAEGEVIGVDLAENLLQLARQKAAKLSLQNIHFRTGDLLALDFGPEIFDTVVCVFGIFFVPDMTAGVREMWSRVKPGGKLAVTTWGRNLFEPANEEFWRAVADVRPELYKGFNPWDRIDNQTDLLTLLHEAGVQNVEIEQENRWHPVQSPLDWWTIVLGSGYRGTVEQLGPDERGQVKAKNLARLREQAIRQIQTNVLYSVASKAPG